MRTRVAANAYPIPELSLREFAVYFWNYFEDSSTAYKESGYLGILRFETYVIFVLF